MKEDTSVKVELLGVYRKAAGVDRIFIDVKAPRVKLQKVISKICELAGPKFEAMFIDPESHDPRSSSLILVNGREIGVLKGLETRIVAGDVITLLPVTHGG